MTRALAIESAAVALHDFIRSNAGETADWPLMIISTCPEDVERLNQLLRDVKKAIEMKETK